MSDPTVQNFYLESGTGKGTSVQLHLHHWDKQQARLKGLMWAGPVLIGGLLTIFIPIVHFVSVPAALIIAPVVYLTVTKLFGSGMSYRGEAICPACGKTTRVTGSAESFPTYTNCYECRGSLKISDEASTHQH